MDGWMDGGMDRKQARACMVGLRRAKADCKGQFIASLSMRERGGGRLIMYIYILLVEM